jgi:hypothetical protein
VLTEDVLDHETEIRKGQERQVHATRVALHVTIAPTAGGRLAVYLNVVLGEIDQPGFANAGATVERGFGAAIKTDGGIGNFNDQQDVLGTRVASRIKIRAWGQKGHIWLGFRAVIEVQRVLDSNKSLPSHMQNKKLVQAIDIPGMTAADSGHLDNLPFNEFNPIILMENPGSGHLVVLVHGK